MIRIECVIVHYIHYRQSGKILKLPMAGRPSLACRLSPMYNDVPLHSTDTGS
jgi:hypothetical protein